MSRWDVWDILDEIGHRLRFPGIRHEELQAMVEAIPGLIEGLSPSAIRSRVNKIMREYLNRTPVDEERRGNISPSRSVAEAFRAFVGPPPQAYDKPSFHGERLPSYQHRMHRDHTHEGPGHVPAYHVSPAQGHSPSTRGYENSEYLLPPSSSRPAYARYDVSPGPSVHRSDYERGSHLPPSICSSSF